MDDLDSKNPPIVAQSVDDDDIEDAKFWTLHSDGSVMIHESTGEFIDVVYLADDDSDDKMIKCGLTAEMAEEVKLRWANYESWLDQRNEEDEETVVVEEEE